MTQEHPSDESAPDEASADELTQPLPGVPSQPIPMPTHDGWDAVANDELVADDEPVMPAPAAGQAPPPPPVAGPPEAPSHALPPATVALPAAAAPPTAPPSPRRGLPLGTWLGVAAVALVVSLVGGVSGAALFSAIDDSRPDRIRSGLEGVRTQTAAPLQADNGSIAAVAQALLPSTVQIMARQSDDAGATGSGFVLDREGHIVTNNHVVASAARASGSIVVIDHEGERHEASVVGRSAVYDLAVLSIDDGTTLEPAALGQSSVLRVGDPVVALGSPLGLSQTVTSGIISALDRPVTTSGQQDDEASYINAVQTDAAINPGNSGGPLVNLAGEVVGVNSAIATMGGTFGGETGNIGVGFAIPIEQVRTTVDQILRTGEAQYPIIGAQVQIATDNNRPGALITDVTEGSPAQDAGLAADDLVTAIEGRPVADGIALIVAIRTHVPGERIELTVQRGDEERDVVLELDGQVG